MSNEVVDIMDRKPTITPQSHNQGFIKELNRNQPQLYKVGRKEMVYLN